MSQKNLRAFPSMYLGYAVPFRRNINYYMKTSLITQIGSGFSVLSSYNIHFRMTMFIIYFSNSTNVLNTYDVPEILLGEKISMIHRSYPFGGYISVKSFICGYSYNNQHIVFSLIMSLYRTNIN